MLVYGFFLKDLAEQFSYLRREEFKVPLTVHQSSGLGVTTAARAHTGLSCFGYSGLQERLWVYKAVRVRGSWGV